MEGKKPSANPNEISDELEKIFWQVMDKEGCSSIDCLDIDDIKKMMKLAQENERKRTEGLEKAAFGLGEQRGAENERKHRTFSEKELIEKIAKLGFNNVHWHEEEYRYLSTDIFLAKMKPLWNDLKEKKQVEHKHYTEVYENYRSQAKMLLASLGLEPVEQAKAREKQRTLGIVANLIGNSDAAKRDTLWYDKATTLWEKLELTFADFPKYNDWVKLQDGSDLLHHRLGINPQWMQKEGNSKVITSWLESEGFDREMCWAERDIMEERHCSPNDIGFDEVGKRVAAALRAKSQPESKPAKKKDGE